MLRTSHIIRLIPEWEMMTSTDSESGNLITYHLDRKDRITHVGGNWDHFAIENNSTPACLSDKVCNRPLVDFITGDETRMWVCAVFMLARARQQVVEKNYRCDSPDERRYMLMRVFPSQDGELEVQHEILRCEKRSHPVNFTPFAGKLPRSHIRCSICGRLLYGGVWVEPETVRPPDGQSLGSHQQFRVNYGICEDCRQSVAQNNESQMRDKTH